jgi:hypothetical protein
MQTQSFAGLTEEMMMSKNEKKTLTATGSIFLTLLMISYSGIVSAAETMPDNEVGRLIYLTVLGLMLITVISFGIFRKKK